MGSRDERKCSVEESYGGRTNRKKSEGNKTGGSRFQVCLDNKEDAGEGLRKHLEELPAKKMGSKQKGILMDISNISGDSNVNKFLQKGGTIRVSSNYNGKGNGKMGHKQAIRHDSGRANLKETGVAGDLTKAVVKKKNSSNHKVCMQMDTTIEARADSKDSLAVRF
ncbi:hypothetical protein ACOSQ4_002350 [Xanthoceras sorbifolium]